MNRLEGKVAVITGTSVGIGLETARLFASEGAKVVMMARREERLAFVADVIAKEGGTAIYMAGDVTKPEDCAKLMQLAWDTYGRLDVLVNNAGALDFHMTAVNVTDELWNHVLTMDLTSRVYCLRAALPYMTKQGSGSIINLGSIAGHYGHGGISTSAAFSAIEGVTRNIALQYSESGIRCNAVCPGPSKHDPQFDAPTDHAFAPKERKPEEAAFTELCGRHRAWIEATTLEQANIILFLASDESSALTGQCLISDHGMCL